MKFRINFKALIVIVFGIFCVYCYFRLINPYLSVGQSVELAPENVFYRQKIIIDGFRYSYWTNGVANPGKIVVMLPPSTATGDYFGMYSYIFPKDVLIIAPDYPGRGFTDSIKEFDTAPLLADRVAILLKNILGDKKFDVVGPSFGGMVGTELAKHKELKIGKMFLIATGEFFTADQKFMYKLLFYPAKVSEQIRKGYVNFLSGEDRFVGLGNTNIQDILEQWLTVIDYKIDMVNKSDVPTVIIAFEKDNVVIPESVIKLEDVFKYSSVIKVDLAHTSGNFFKPEVQSILKSGI